jgi:hypothetical protein
LITIDRGGSTERTPKTIFKLTRNASRIPDIGKVAPPQPGLEVLPEEEGGERIQAAYGKNHARLVELKTKWDPRNLFRMNKNIAPADERKSAVKSC